MEKKLTITKIERNRDNTVYEDGIKELVIKPMKGYQFISVANIINKFIRELNANESVAGTLSGLFDTVEVGMETNEILQNVGAQFIKDGVGSLSLLLEVAPTTVIEIVANAAGITPYELEFQEVDVLFDIFDAVVEVNDMEKLKNRVNLSIKGFRKAMGWATVVDQATSPKLVN